MRAHAGSTVSGREPYGTGGGQGARTTRGAGRPPYFPPWVKHIPGTHASSCIRRGSARAGKYVSSAILMAVMVNRRKPTVLCCCGVRACWTMAWGDNEVSSCGSYSRAKGPGTSADTFSYGAVPIRRGSKGSSAGCEGVLWDPPGPPEVAALTMARSRRSSSPASFSVCSSATVVTPGGNRSSQPGGSSGWEGAQNTPYKRYGGA